MRKLAFALILASFLSSVFAQVPRLEVFDSTHTDRLLSEVMSDEKNYLVSFWQSLCSPCIDEYDAWAPYADSWIDECNVEILAIALTRATGKNDKETWDDKGWRGRLFFAHPDSAMAAFGFPAIPQVYLYNTKGDLIYEHLGFRSGDEVELNEVIYGLKTSNIEEEIVEDDVYWYQDHEYVYFDVPEKMQSGQVSIISTHGALVRQFKWENPDELVRVAKTDFLRSGGYIFHMQNRHIQVSSTFILHK